MKEENKAPVLYLIFIVISGCFLIHLQIYGKDKPVDYVSLLIFVYISVIVGLPFISKYINTMKFLTFDFSLREQVKGLQAKNDDLEVKQNALEVKQDVLNAKHDDLEKNVQERLNEILVYSMSWYIYDILKRLRDGNQEYIYDDSEHVRRNLQFLQDHGFVNFKPLLSDLKKGDNLIGYINLTPCGQRFVELREQYESEYQHKLSVPNK